jgi:hypothetical protein
MAVLPSPGPRFVFCVVEPFLLFSGFTFLAFSIPTYVTSLSPTPHASEPLPTEQILAFQLCNVYLLLAFINIFVLITTGEIKVVRAYLSALWWGDMGHLGSTAWCLGRAGMSTASSWSFVIWANFLILSFLFLARTLYFLGVFGPDAIGTGEKDK